MLILGIPAIFFTIIAIPYLINYLITNPLLEEIRHGYLLGIEIFGLISFVFWYTTLYFYSKYNKETNDQCK
jgi:hypothetical protein